MLTENPRELSALLAKIPGESPRVFGWGARLTPWDKQGHGAIITDHYDDFFATEALLLAEVSPERKLSLPRYN